MTATVSTYDNTTKRASNVAQENSLGTSRNAELESFDYRTGEAATNACARQQREYFSFLERVLAAR